MSANTAALPASRASTSSGNIPIILTLVGVVADIILRVTAWRERQANRALLYSMSDRSLKDIGLTRSDIERVTQL